MAETGQEVLVVEGAAEEAALFLQQRDHLAELEPRRYRVVSGEVAQELLAGLTEAQEQLFL